MVYCLLLSTINNFVPDYGFHHHHDHDHHHHDHGHHYHEARHHHDGYHHHNPFGDQPFPRYNYEPVEGYQRNHGGQYGDYIVPSQFPIYGQQPLLPEHRHIFGTASGPQEYDISSGFYHFSGYHIAPSPITYPTAGFNEFLRRGTDLSAWTQNYDGQAPADEQQSYGARSYAEGYVPEIFTGSALPATQLYGADYLGFGFDYTAEQSRWNGPAAPDTAYYSDVDLPSLGPPNDWSDFNRNFWSTLQR